MVRELPVGEAAESGLTGGDGRIPFPLGAEVEFSVGGIVLGTASVVPVVTPVDLVVGAVDERDPTVTNLAVFLQSVDETGSVADGITIGSSSRDALADLSLDFSVPSEDFVVGAGLRAVLDAVGVTDPVSIQDARSHLRRTLLSTFSGEYRGTYLGGERGDLQLVVGIDGTVVGEFEPDGAAAIEVLGSVSSNGETGFGSVVAGRIFGGTFRGTPSGDWTVFDGSLSGDWSLGRRVDPTFDLRRLQDYRGFAFAGAFTTVDDLGSEILVEVELSIDGSGAPALRVTSGGAEAAHAVFVTSVDAERGAFRGASGLGLAVDGEFRSDGGFTGAVSEFGSGRLVGTFTGERTASPGAAAR